MNSNFSDYPPPLEYKYNASKGRECVPFGEHPYLSEILEFESQVTSNVGGYLRQLRRDIKDSTFQGWNSDFQPFIRLETEEEIDSAILMLSKLKFFFFDTKTHGEYYHIFPRVLVISFIQCRQYEYIIDLETVSPKLVAKFNEVFTNPDIVKVCFDSLHKIMHLQRHFSLYFVNLYDCFYNTKRLVSFYIKDSKEESWHQRNILSIAQLDRARENAHEIFKIFIRSDLSSQCVELGTRTAKIWKHTRYHKRTIFTDEIKHLFYVFMWFERDTMARMKDFDPERILSIRALAYLADHYQEFINESFKKAMYVDSTFRRAGPELAVKFLYIASDPSMKSTLLSKWDSTN